MVTPVSSRSSLMNSLAARWWETRLNKGLLPRRQYELRLKSVHRFAVHVGWRYLAALADGEVRRVQESNEEIQKRTVEFAKRGSPGYRGASTDLVVYDENVEANPDDPDVWPGGGPVHPDDR